VGISVLRRAAWPVLAWHVHAELPDEAQEIRPIGRGSWKCPSRAWRWRA